MRPSASPSTSGGDGVRKLYGIDRFYDIAPCWHETDTDNLPLMARNYVVISSYAEMSKLDKLEHPVWMQTSPYLACFLVGEDPLLWVQGAL